MNVFEKEDYKLAFEEFRKLPDNVFSKYFDLLRIGKNKNGVLLDLGAGPGLQSIQLINSLPEKWKLLLVEPSKKLITSAKNRLHIHANRINYQNNYHHELHYINEIDIIWLSEIVHLLGDSNIWLSQIAPVLKKNSQILVRTSTHDQLSKRMWYDFFPAALDFDLNRHPHEKSMINSFHNNGFINFKQIEIEESRIIESKLLYQMLKNKCFSTLHKISKKDYHKGMQKLSSFLEGKQSVKWDYKMTAYYAELIN